jgi:hypothetical protein
VDRGYKKFQKVSDNVQILAGMTSNYKPPDLVSYKPLTKQDKLAVQNVLE